MLEDSEAVAVVTTSDMEPTLRGILPNHSVRVVSIDSEQKGINQQDPGVRLGRALFCENLFCLADGHFSQIDT